MTVPFNPVTPPDEPPPDDRLWVDRMLSWLLGPLPEAEGVYMRMPRVLILCRSRGVLEMDEVLPPRPTAAKPYYKVWEEMERGEVISIPFSKVTWLLPRRILIVVVAALSIAGILAWQGSWPAGIALMCVLVVSVPFWKIMYNRIAIGVIWLAFALTVLIGWSLVHLMLILLVLLFAAMAWDIVNGIRFTDELSATSERLQPHKGLISPKRLPNVGGESIDEIGGSRGFWSNLLGLDVGWIEIKTNSGRIIKRKHVPSWQRVMDVLDGINRGGGMSVEQARLLVLMKAAFNRRELSVDDITEEVGPEVAERWVRQREELDLAA